METEKTEVKSDKPLSVTQRLINFFNEQENPVNCKTIMKELDVSDFVYDKLKQLVNIDFIDYTIIKEDKDRKGIKYFFLKSKFDYPRNEYNRVYKCLQKAKDWLFVSEIAERTNCSATYINVCLEKMPSLIEQRVGKTSKRNARQIRLKRVE